MKGNYRELSIREQMIPDGAGGETKGLALRLWVDDADEDPDDVLAVELYLRDGVEVPSVGEFVGDVLSVFELEIIQR